MENFHLLPGAFGFPTEGRGERGELVALVALVPLANSQQLTTVGGQRLVARGRGAARGGP